MHKPLTPAHLPHAPSNPVAYEALYERIYNCDELYLGDEPWQERRIPPDLPAAAVYRRLPVAPEFEYGGYLTNTRIRFRRCSADRADFNASKPCTFHSHPTVHRYADIPSDLDVYGFLRYRHLRTVTIGSSLVWWFDKDVATMRTVARLNAWEAAHMLDTVGVKCSFEEYPSVALRAIGLRWPRSAGRRTAKWQTVLRESLAIHTTIVDRRPE